MALSLSDFFPRWALGKQRAKGFAPVADVSESLASLMFGRLGVLYALLVVIILTQVFGKSFASNFHFALGYALLLFGFAFNLFQAAFLEKIPANWGTIVSHILFDTTLTSTWVYYSGGRESIYALLYLVQILIVALIFYQKAALFAAACASMGFGVVTLLGSGEGASFFSWGIYSSLFLVLGIVGGALSHELHDATQSLRQKELTIDRLKSFHEKIIESLPTGWLTVDQQMRITFINPTGAHLLGRQPSELVGRSLMEVEPDLMPFFSQIEEAPVEEEEGTETEVSSTGDPQHPSYFMRTRSHARLQQTVALKGKTLRGDVAEIDADPAMGQFIAQDAPKGRVLLFQDVTKILHLEEKLKQHEKMAAVGQLAAGIAHEIRNPLASMSGSIELLRGTLPEKGVSDEEKKLMDIALKEIDRLNHLISEFLDFVRPDHLEIKSVSLPELLSELVLSARQRKESQTGVEFKENYEPNVLAKASAEKLRQVVWNLLVNALQAMDKEGTIEVGCRKAGGNRVKFWVKDQGLGMSEEVLHRLFEPFFTTKPRGTGLGLATAYKIVEAHLGEIRVKSEPKRGTEFEVILPAA